MTRRHTTCYRTSSELDFFGEQCMEVFFRERRICPMWLARHQVISLWTLEVEKPSVSKLKQRAAQILFGWALPTTSVIIQGFAVSVVEWITMRLWRQKFEGCWRGGKQQIFSTLENRQIYRLFMTYGGLIYDFFNFGVKTIHTQKKPYFE